MPPRVKLQDISATSRTIARHHTTGRMEPAISTGADVDALKQRLSPLLSTNGGRWTLTKNGEAMERTFKFKTFTKTWDFMTAVSLQCKIKNHHPEWSNIFNTTFIRWTTHVPKGLSAKDVELATLCDSLAKDFGEVQEPVSTSCEMQGLTERVMSSAGACCTPKSATS